MKIIIIIILIIATTKGPADARRAAHACVLLEIDMWKLVEGKPGDEMTLTIIKQIRIIRRQIIIILKIMVLVMISIIIVVPIIIITIAIVTVTVIVIHSAEADALRPDVCIAPCTPPPSARL